MNRSYKNIIGLMLAVCIVLFLGTECMAQENAIAVTPGTLEVNIPSTVDMAAGLPMQQCGFIYIGDSRCVGLDMITGFSKDPYKWMVAKTAKGYGWLEDAAAQVDAIEVSNPQITKWYEIYMFGLNDPGNMEKYAQWYAQRAPGHNVVLVSLNPIKYHGSITNEKIALFNQTLLMTGLPYIDCYSYLWTNGFECSDGVHYTKSTYVTIDSLINSALSKIAKQEQ